MATFKAQVEGITQLTVGTTPTEDELSQFLVDGTKEVINRIISIRPDELNKFTTSTHDAADSGITASGKILSVVREHDDVSILRKCTLIAPGDRYTVSDSTSLRYRSKYNPGFYELDGKIYTIPASAAGNNDAIVTQVYYAVNQGHSSSSIDSFPDEYEYLVVLYSSLRTIHAYMSSLPVAAFTDFSLTAAAPDVIVSPVISSDGVATTPKADISGNQPQYNAGAVIGFAGSAHFADLATKTITDLSTTAVTPDVPTLTAVTYDTSAGAASDINAGAVPNLDKTTTVQGVGDIAKIDVDLSGLTFATYTPPVPPDTPVDPTDAGTIGATTDSDPLGKMEDYVTTEEDSELASSMGEVIASMSTNYADKINKYSTDLNMYQQEMADALNVFNDTNAELLKRFDAEVADAAEGNKVVVQNLQKDLDIIKTNQQKQLSIEQADAAAINSAALQDAIQTTQAIIANNTSLAQDYGAQANVYQMEVATEVQEYQANTTKEVQLWTNQQNQIIAQHGAKMQDSLNLFNRENVIYQANIQAEITQAQIDAQEAQKEGDLLMQAQLQDYTFTLQKYQADIGKYSAEVNAEVQEYQSSVGGTTKEYEWCVDQYSRLKAEYDASFIALAPLAASNREEARGRNRQGRVARA